MIFTYTIGLKSNKESNDFLRCLWARIRIHFGNLGWLFQPMRSRNNFVHFGFASFGDNYTFGISCHYKTKGCLHAICFENTEDNEDLICIKRQLDVCIEEANCFNDYLQSYKHKFFLDGSLLFKKNAAERFSIDKKEISFQIEAYDKIDAMSLAKVHLNLICSILTFDLLKYVSASPREMKTKKEELDVDILLKNNHSDNFITDDGSVENSHNVGISPEVISYIDSYLNRPYLYEDHFSLFEKSVVIFAQAIWNEEQSHMGNKTIIPYAEQAILLYMSALEIITQEDIEPQKCNECGQTTYSIAKRVRQLVEKAIGNGTEFAKLYYGYRSNFVHLGEYLSNYNYMGQSIPLLSKKTKEGAVFQVSMLEIDIKKIVKKCILWHEKHES